MDTLKPPTFLFQPWMGGGGRRGEARYTSDIQNQLLILTPTLLSPALLETSYLSGCFGPTPRSLGRFCSLSNLTSYLYESEDAQLCPTLCNPMDCSPLVSPVHGIFQARILVWVAMPFLEDLPDPGIKPASLLTPALADRFFTTSATWEARRESVMN